MKNCNITSFGIWVKENQGSEYFGIQVKFTIDGLLITKNYFANFNVEDGIEYAANYPKKKPDGYGISEDSVIIIPSGSKTFVVDGKVVDEMVCNLLFTYQEEKYKLKITAFKNDRTRDTQPHFKMRENAFGVSLLSKLSDADTFVDDDILYSELENKFGHNDDDGDDEIPEDEKKNLI